MTPKKATGRSERKIFYEFPRRVYGSNPCHRSTEETLTRLLVDGPTVFHGHAAVIPHLFLDGGTIVARCALIHDSKLPDCIQVAFFEALPGLREVPTALADAARSLRTGATRLIIGLNGHLNYGAGFLLDQFDEPPVFGLPYTPPYYAEYFNGLECRESVSFRFPLQPVYDWVWTKDNSIDLHGFTVRGLDKRNLRRDIELYTYIDNATFSASGMPYWTNRLPEENYELFHPFRFLIRPEHLMFAEKDGEPAAFVLWYPDFNQLVPPDRDLNIGDVIRFRFANPVRTIRLAEAAVVPKFRRSMAIPGIIIESLKLCQKAGYEICEGGFIFNDNADSINLTQRFVERGHGKKFDPHRHYGIFEMSL